MAERPAIARVRPDSRVPQLDREFDYRIPPGLSVVPGVRVRIPMGRGSRIQTGFVTAVVDTSDFGGTLQDVEDVVSEVPVLTPELLSLATAVAERHAGGVTDVLRLAIPPRGVRVEKAWRESLPVSRPGIPAIAPSGSYEQGALDEMVKQGSRSWLQLPYGVIDSRPRGIEEIARLAASVLSGGSSVVVSVPDWRDVSFTHEALVELLGEEYVARFDADQPAGERYRHFLRGLEDDPVVVVGSRHAIYAPVSKLGLIVVLNDADDLHREPLAPYPHTRDVALLRAELSGASLVLASVIPSMAVTRLIGLSYLKPVRPGDARRPRVMPTALSTTQDASESHARLPSIAFRAAKEALQKGPVLVQVFRAGYSPGLACAQCRERARCRECQGPLKAAQKGQRERCSWCGLTADSWRCSLCGENRWVPIGQAVGRTVAELGRAFSKVPIIQADGDHRKLRIPGNPALVVATRGAEPVAPDGYAAALLLDGESMLQRQALGALTETLHSWESALALLAPGAQAYLTDVDGPIAHAMAADSVESLLTKELDERALVKLPPAVRLVLVEGQRAVVSELVSRMTVNFPALDTIGPMAGEKGATRTLLKVPYADAPAVARELRAAVVASAISRGRAVERLKVSMDGLAALDEFSAQPQ